jgi:hypothetical protein
VALYPEIAVVVHVVQGVPGLLQGLAEPYLGSGRPVVFALLNVEGTQEQLAVLVERTPTEGEAVQVRVGPVERHLQHLMYDVER